MKVLMLEYYKDSSVSLIQGDTVQVNDSLGEWLIKNRKAARIEQPVPEVEQVEELQPEQPSATLRNRARSRRTNE